MADKEDRRGAELGNFGNLPYVPTEDNRRLVKTLAAYGNRQVDIATILEISQDTLKRHYDRELKTGALEANAKIAEKMYNKALTGDNSAMQYWLSRRAGWKETSVHEHTGAGGGAIQYQPETDKAILERFKKNGIVPKTTSEEP